MLEQELGNLLPAEVPFATILTMIEVDPDDPAFGDPTKFVGPVYEKAEADAAGRREGLGRSSRTATSGAAWSRRPSPSGSSRSGRSGGCWSKDVVVICAGGGGDPDDVRAGRRADPRRRRGRDRQGPRERAARARGRGRPVRDGDRRGRRLRGLGHAGAAQARAGHARRAPGQSSSPPDRWDPRSRPRSGSSSGTGKRAAIGGLADIEQIVEGTGGTQVVAS